jgi:membrane dipeptidase
MNMISRTRRLLLASSGLALGLAVLPRSSQAVNGKWSRYSRAVVIDGLGGPGGHATEDGSELTTSEVDDIRASGMTCLHLTVGEVGTMPPDVAYQKAVASIARWEAEVDRYPATMVRVR